MQDLKLTPAKNRIIACLTHFYGAIQEGTKYSSQKEIDEKVEIKDRDFVESLDPALKLTSNEANCHGFTFAKGQVWINNDQVKDIIEGDGYVERKDATPQIGDVGIYALGGKLSKSQHSGTVSELGSDGKVSFIRGKGGIEPVSTLPPGPGPGTAWDDKNSKLVLFYKRNN